MAPDKGLSDTGGPTTVNPGTSDQLWANPRALAGLREADRHVEARRWSRSRVPQCAVTRYAPSRPPTMAARAVAQGHQLEP